jgi:hypothetical protein
MNKSLVVTTLGLLAACAAHPLQRDMQLVDDARVGQSLDHFAYTGQWEHESTRADGRYAATSTRSHHSGDSVTLPFDGSVVRLYGVRGPNGGSAAVGIDGQYYGDAVFYAPKKQAHALVFSSPPLPEGTHTLGLVVKLPSPGSHRAYVNIDDVEVLHHQ